MTTSQSPKKWTAKQIALCDALHSTVEDIASSNKVESFTVGVTGSLSSRLSSYRNFCKKNDSELRGFVILDWGHSPKTVVVAEEMLFDRLHQKHKKYATNNTKRYHRAVNKKLEDQYLYMAWWAPPIK